MQDLSDAVDDLYEKSLSKYLLDTPFTLEEVENAVHKLKPGKASGRNGLIGEHLIHGDQTILSWLRNILNAIVEVKAIPSALKSGSITGIPIYKGNGKDPLNADSYWGGGGGLC